jgi:hypothetical protein
VRRLSKAAEKSLGDVASIATYRYLLPCISMCMYVVRMVGNHSKFDDLAFTDKVVVDDGDPSPSSPFYI